MEKRKINITFDLETLGRVNAPIVQLAAVAFTDDGKIEREFDYYVDLEDLSNYKFDFDYSTLSWWMQQDYNAIKSVFSEESERLSLKDVLTHFSIFMDRWSTDEFDISVWSHATFDPPILQNAYNKVGLQTPIHYRWNRDIRTLCELSGVEKTEVKGVAHNALDDCINQAEYIARGIQILNNLWKR